MHPHPPPRVPMHPRRPRLARAERIARAGARRPPGALVPARRFVGVVAILGLSLLVACADGQGSTGSSGPAAPAGSSGTFVALTYNVQGLPSFITGDDTTARIAQIGPLLGAFDIVGIQEDFIDDNHALLSEACTLATRTRFADKLGGRAFGSGLATFARLKLLAHEGRHYSTCNGKLSQGSDCLASKGVLFNRLELVPGVELDLYVTHLDAGSSPGDMAAKTTQVDELIAFVAERSAGRAVLLIGDFNLDPVGQGEQAKLVARIDEAAGLRRACAASACPEPDHIDQQHFRGGGGLTLEAELWRDEPAFFDAQGEPLSDHPALSVRYRWAR